MFVQRALVGLLFTSSASLAAPAQKPRDVVRLVEAIDKAEPLDRQTLEGLIGRLRCSEDGGADCDGRDIDLGDEVVGDLDFRPRAAGSLLILKGFTNACVSIPLLTDRYGPGTLEQSCTDGVICRYLTVKRPWGSLSIGIDDPLRPACATSVIMNSISG